MYAVFDPTGLPLAFYDPDVHGDAIPTAAVEITADEWSRLLTREARWNGSAVVAYVPPPDPAPDTLTVSRRQFYQQLASAPYSEITEDEMLAAFGGVIPEKLLGGINQLPAERRLPAKALAAGATEFERDNPVCAALAAMIMGWSDEQRADFWNAAGRL